MLTVHVYTRKSSDKHCICPLWKTAVNGYENDVLNRPFSNAGKLLENIKFYQCLQTLHEFVQENERKRNGKQGVHRRLSKALKQRISPLFSWRSHKEKAELKERFPISENGLFIQDLPGIHRSVKLTVNEGFLAMLGIALDQHR